jgi:hypothetical protein
MTTIVHAGVDRYATASRADARSYQHQMNAAAALGRARGVTQRHTPAVVYDDMQAVRLGRAVDARSFSRIFHWLPVSSRATDRRAFLTSLAGARRTFPAARHCAERGAFHSAIASGCSPTIRQSLAHHQTICRTGDVPHSHLSCRSSSVAFAGFEPSEASNGRVPKSCGAFPKKKGEFPNVGC